MEDVFIALTGRDLDADDELAEANAAPETLTAGARC